MSANLGFEKINGMIPYKRQDENRSSDKALPKRKRGDSDRYEDDSGDEGEEATKSKTETIPPRLRRGGGAHNRVFWPVGKRDWVVADKRE